MPYMNDYVSFPALGWKFPLSKVLVEFDIGDSTFSITWYGLIIAIGFLLAVVYALRRARSFDIDPDRLIDVTLVSAIFAFIGARLYYVLFSGHLDEYLANPLSILATRDGGMAIYGGVIMAFVTALWMSKVRKVNTLALFDLGALGFLIGQGIGRWGNFFNQEAFGGNTTLPWGMSGSDIAAGLHGENFNPALPVHPTFLYESLWCLLGFLVLHIVSKKAYKFKGEIFSLYLIWYGVGRCAIEGLRTDSLYLGQMRVSQLLSALAVLLGVLLFFLFRARGKALPKDLFAQTADGLVLAELDEAPTDDIEDLTAAAGDKEESIHGDTH